MRSSLIAALAGFRSPRRGENGYAHTSQQNNKKPLNCFILLLWRNTAVAMVRCAMLGLVAWCVGFVCLL